MSRVCAWILLLVFRLRVVLRGCASKFRSHGRRRVDFPWKSGDVVLARPCVGSLVSRQASCRFLLGSRAALSLRGRASKFRAHGRRRVDFSWKVGRLCPCEVVRRSLDRPEGVASFSVGVRRFSRRETSGASKFSAHGASK
ncbi:hypothetical protein NDU88_004375 [Pleurodeles waltl]|uniref:Secreted protein n=1 Tax=Pleurodeles waltl TaxID=8319 RepID=A0AAV7TTC5_PLEWA|nr:hypothetical protein NDU88_004375 [Pleurodeles waltl]